MEEDKLERHLFNRIVSAHLDEATFDPRVVLASWPEGWPRPREWMVPRSWSEE
jgi:hypothetical protein